MEVVLCVDRRLRVNRDNQKHEFEMQIFHNVKFVFYQWPQHLNIFRKNMF